MEYRLRQVARPASVTTREVFSNGVLYVENNEVTTTREPWMLEMIAHRGYELVVPKRGRGRPAGTTKKNESDVTDETEVTETKES